MRSQASSPVERYADYKTHCLHENGWANAGVTIPIPPMSSKYRPARRCTLVQVGTLEQGPLQLSSSSDSEAGSASHHMMRKSYQWMIYIIPKDKVKAESFLIIEHSFHTSMCINNASLFLAYPSINWRQNSVHILLKLNDDSLFITYISYVASDNLWYLK